MPKFNRKEPLGLPRGSTRAIIALLLTVAFAFRFVVGLPVDPVLAATLSMVLTYYFTQRDRETTDNPTEEPLGEPDNGD